MAIKHNLRTIFFDVASVERPGSPQQNGGMNDSEAEVHLFQVVSAIKSNIEINMELLKASIIELPDDKRLEIYRWIYETFPKCRIYER